jgi:hypothetical protein
MAQYNGSAVIPLKAVCRDYFCQLTPAQFARKAIEGEIDLPVIRTETSQKAARGVHLSSVSGFHIRAPRSTAPMAA